MPRGEGPVTVFAPTDEAFASLPTGTLESLLLPEDREELRAILAHHVVPGRLISDEVANVEDPQMTRTAGGGRERIGADGRRLAYGDATVLRADVACTNGIIHVIDRVVLPRALPSEDRMRMAMKEAEPAFLLEALREVADGRFSTFLAAVEASGGDQDWAQPEPSGNWTVLVPTNEAFVRLTEAERAMLLDPRNRDLLRAVLDWHAVPTLQAWSFDVDRGQRSPNMISQQGDRFVLDVLGNGMVFVFGCGAPESIGPPRSRSRPASSPAASRLAEAPCTSSTAC